MKIEPTFTVTIWVGFREHYSDNIHWLEEVYDVCQEYCDIFGLCVTVTPTAFIYKEGNEPGCAIGLINYPRFPSTHELILKEAFDISEILLKKFHQFKVTIICNDKTYMLEESDFQ